MKKLIKLNMVLLLALASQFSYAEHNVVLVTIDGLRWQEVFNGVDEKLLNNTDVVKDNEKLKADFWDEDIKQRQKLLMPFITQTIAKKGAIIGDRNNGSTMSVSNPWYFSYPGYNEILTGTVDEGIDSNDSVLNPNKTILELLEQQPEYKNKTALFASWDAFPFIVNDKRSKVFVNAGFMPLDESISAQVPLLNSMQNEIPTPWPTVRYDSFTYHFAKAYLDAKKPRLLVISFGETDDFAHDGDYEHYLKSANQTDTFIKELWQTIQTTAGYKDNTTLIITTDHGRGSNANDWQHHSSKKALEKMSEKAINAFPDGIVGSQNIWLAAIGPVIKPIGLVKTHGEIKQAQIAATIIKALGKKPQNINSKMASAIDEILK